MSDNQPYGGSSKVEATFHDGTEKRDPECVKVWPECAVGEFDPRCCRFPKSCSCWVDDK